MEREYVERRIVFETVIGSRAYGIHNPESDYDKAGIMIPGIEYLYGFKKFEQYQGYEDDKTIYSLQKGIRLMADNNPNMLDLLWAPEHCVVRTSPYWDDIRAIKDSFLSKKCRYTFSGYAIAQLERIKTHRKFILNPPKSIPTRKDYGLSETSLFPTAQIKAICQAALDCIAPGDIETFVNELDSIYGDYIIPLFMRFLIPEQRAIAMEWLQLGIKGQLNAFNCLGTVYLKDEYIEMARKELAYYNAKHEYDRYVQWQKTRNKARSELEEKFHMDTKHASHLVRLCRMGMEILETGKVNVDRTNIDAEELIAIRKGAWTYEQIEAYAQDIEAKLEKLYSSSTLPKSPDINKIDDTVVSVCKRYIDEIG